MSLGAVLSGVGSFCRVVGGEARRPRPEGRGGGGGGRMVRPIPWIHRGGPVR